MKLYMDTSSSEEITIKLDGKIFKTKARKEKSQKLLPFIDEILKKEKKKVEDIKEIEVNTGPGSFTGLRIGVSVANAIGWALDIPVNGEKVGQSKTIDIKYK